MVTFAYRTHLAQNYYYYVMKLKLFHHEFDDYDFLLYISVNSQQAHRRVLVLEGSVNFITKW